MQLISWRYHAAHINSKISRAIFAIKQLKFTVPLSILKTLYFALIPPHLSYGIRAWGNAGSKILHKTIQLQKYAIRTIHKAAYNSHTDPLFNKSQILKLTDMYEYESVLFMYDFVENNLPHSFGDVFRYNRDVQTSAELANQTWFMSIAVILYFRVDYLFTLYLLSGINGPSPLLVGFLDVDLGILHICISYPTHTVRNTLREIELQNDYCNGCGLTDHGCGMILLSFFTFSSLCDTEKVSF